MKRQQSFDKILETTIVGLDKVRKQQRDLQKQFDVLILLIILIVLTTGIGFWMITG